MAAPPMKAGAVKAMPAWVSPAVAVAAVGAPGTTAATVNVWLTWGAARKLLSPAWLALMVQLPAATKVRAPPPVIVHTPVVEEVKLTGYPPPALEVAASVGVVPKFCVPGLPKVMVCGDAGVTELEAAEALPSPAELVAVTLKV